VLTAIELNDEAPFATNEIHVIWTNRLLASEFEAAELADCEACSKAPILLASARAATIAHG